MRYCRNCGREVPKDAKSCPNCGWDMKSKLDHTIDGGYKLSKKPSEYKVGEILRVAEGDLNVIDCVHDFQCPRKTICDTYSFWKGLDIVINEYADSYTLEELIK